MGKNNNKSETVSTLVNPEKYVIDLGGGKKVEYIISHVPAMRAMRILTALESPSDEVREEAEMDLLSYTAHNEVILSNEGVVENHIPSLKALVLLKEKMKAYNFGFFTDAGFQKEWKVLHPAPEQKGA